MHGGRFQDAAQLVEVVQRVEVQRLDQPAIALPHFQVALPLKSEQRFAHRSAADLQAVGDLGLGETVSGREAEVQDVALQCAVCGVGQRARNVDDGEGGSHVWPRIGGLKGAGAGDASELQGLRGAQAIGFAPRRAYQLHAQRQVVVLSGFGPDGSGADRQADA